MKRSRRHTGLEDDENEMAKEPEIDLDQDEDGEDVVDLEDIVEPKDGALEDEEDFDLDTEILDVDSDPGFGDLGAEHESDIDSVGEEDFLVDFSAEEPKKKDLKKAADPAKGHEAEFVDPLFALFTEKPAEPDSEPKEPAKEPLEPRPQPFVLQPSPDRPEVSVTAQEGPAENPPEASVEAPPSLDERLDAFVAQIEAKLLSAVREIVESRLPEIVQAVLREEIDKLKKEEGR